MTIQSLLSDIVGTPQNDLESTVLYLSACVIGTILFFSVVYVFKVISQMFSK